VSGFLPISFSDFVPEPKCFISQFEDLFSLMHRFYVLSDAAHSTSVPLAQQSLVWMGA
jgi:hypothetical protein